MTETLKPEVKEVTKVESVNIRAVGNGYIVDISGKDKNDDWASDQQVFLDKKEAVDFMSAKIGG